MGIKVGVVGAGGIAKLHLKIVSELREAQLVGICDVVKDNAEQAGAEYGIPAFEDAVELLNKTNPDVLFICVPPFAHGPIEELAAERGVHLLIEKPVGLDMDTVRRKAERFRQSNAIVSTGYCLRYMESLRKAREYLQDKQIATVRAQRFSGLVQAPWWREMSKSGGQLVEMTTHTVDMIRYLAGDVTKVYSDSALLLNDHVPNISIPDVTAVSFVLESGAIGQLMTSFIPQPAGRSDLEIAGDGFFLRLEGTTVTITEKDRTIVYESSADFYKEQDEALIQAIIRQDRGLVLASYEEAMKTLEVTLGANESMRTGQPVSLTQGW
ncbi:Gfo/Idh/MocA family protein [Cohnella sp. GCM10027633]|uniref:Gfo/Idh/MocA family protein n=1 Tax=unclassified Cohnella TaxID=2636738 RepID=UPI003634B25D